MKAAFGSPSATTRSVCECCATVAKRRRYYAGGLRCNTERESAVFLILRTGSVQRVSASRAEASDRNRRMALPNFVAYATKFGRAQVKRFVHLPSRQGILSFSCGNLSESKAAFSGAKNRSCL